MIEIGLTPRRQEDYWGGDVLFKDRMKEAAPVWRAAADEAALNNLLLTVSAGSLRHSAPAYPIEIIAKSRGPILAEFIIQGGGQGCIPFILSGVPLATRCRLQRRDSASLPWRDDVSQEVHGNDFSQEYSHLFGMKEITWNLDKGTADLSAKRQFRVIAE
jgi:hypothetical protein